MSPYNRHHVLSLQTFHSNNIRNRVGWHPRNAPYVGLYWRVIDGNRACQQGLQTVESLGCKRPCAGNHAMPCQMLCSEFLFSSLQNRRGTGTVQEYESSEVKSGQKRLLALITGVGLDFRFVSSFCHKAAQY